jgi:hypothetical protein
VNTNEDYEKVLEMLRREASTGGYSSMGDEPMSSQVPMEGGFSSEPEAKSRMPGDVPPGADPLGFQHQRAVMAKDFALKGLHERPTAHSTPPVAAPQMSPGLAAAELDRMRGGIEGMRRDVPGAPGDAEIAAAEIDRLRGGVEGMRRDGPKAPASAASTALAGATGASTASPRSDVGWLEELAAEVDKMKGKQSKKTKKT